jgi:hypothetical protein
MEMRKLNSQEKDIFTALLANAVTRALDETSEIADLMKVECKTIRVLFAEAFVNNMELV